MGPAQRMPSSPAFRARPWPQPSLPDPLDLGEGGGEAVQSALCTPVHVKVWQALHPQLPAQSLALVVVYGQENDVFMHLRKLCDLGGWTAPGGFAFLARGCLFQHSQTPRRQRRDPLYWPPCPRAWHHPQLVRRLSRPPHCVSFPPTSPCKPSPRKPRALGCSDRQAAHQGAKKSTNTSLSSAACRLSTSCCVEATCRMLSGVGRSYQGTVAIRGRGPGRLRRLDCCVGALRGMKR